MGRVWDAITAAVGWIGSIGSEDAVSPPSPIPAPTPVLSPANNVPSQSPSLMFLQPWQEDSYVSYLSTVCSGHGSGERYPAGDYRPRSVLARLECDKRNLVPLGNAWSVPDDAWDGNNQALGRMTRMSDSSDFAALEVLAVLLHPRNNPAVGDELRSKTQEVLLGFKYWYTDPTPPGRPADRMWYWTENHIVAFSVAEYLAGQMLPMSTFLATGWTGSRHHERAAVRLTRWLDDRAKFGFSEWHSDVYYMKDLQALLLLAEHGDNEDLVRKAEMVLDLLFLDLALHVHLSPGGEVPAFGATHGRSYPIDSAAAAEQDTYEVAAILFGDFADPGPGWGGNGVFLAASSYVLPEVIRVIARDENPMVDRERIGVPIDIKPPSSLLDLDSETPPYGLSYTDEEDLLLWWGMNAFTAWPLLPSTIDTANEYNLWERQFEKLVPKAVSNILDWMDGFTDADDYLGLLYPVYTSLWPVLNMAVLNQANTYTYRTKHYMLSTSQDYPDAGFPSNQQRAWKATLSDTAIVFTTHPAKLAIDEGVNMPDNFNWKSDLPGPGYWTGDGSRPRAAQHENVGVYIYNPLYRPGMIAADIADYRDETHAYFPEAHFDEVVQSEKWTFGRSGGGYIALYSNLPTTWRTSQPELHQNGGKHFDLVAEGTAENVWIVELGSIADYANFDAFRSAILANEPVVTLSAEGCDVLYQSPSIGQLSFGWNSPLVVEDEAIPLSDYKRFDNSFVETGFGDTSYNISHPDGQNLLLDFTSRQRLVVIV